MKLPIGSYSFYNSLQNCPHAAYHRYVGKTIPYVQSPEAKWGDEVHQALEKRVRDGEPLPESMAGAAPIAEQFHQYAQHLPVQVEMQLAITQNGRPCAYKDWNNVWFRGKLDCVLLDHAEWPTTAWMVDWKSGNVREDPFELECGALLLKATYLSLQTVHAEYVWLKTGTKGLRYTLDQPRQTFDKLVNLRKEAEDYMAKGDWPKRKTPLCGWCDVKSCEHNTSHRRK